MARLVGSKARVGRPMNGLDVHYRPDGRSRIGCGVRLKGAARLATEVQGFTSDVRKVTCGPCLEYLADIVLRTLDRLDDARMADRHLE